MSDPAFQPGTAGGGPAEAPLISVVTVCRNALATLPPTVESLRAQGAGPWEWVVVDGASTDGSVEWLRDAAPDTWVSEPDAGLYDAMNKAVRLSRGRYVYFLNAGDRFADAGVLGDVARWLQADPAVDLLYGSAVYDWPQGPRQRFDFGHVTPDNILFLHLCHQAVFARRALFQTHGGFDTRYRFVADLAWLARVFRGGGRRRAVPRDICLYAVDGISARNADAMHAEVDRLQREQLGRWASWCGAWKFRLLRARRRLLGPGPSAAGGGRFDPPSGGAAAGGAAPPSVRRS